jgi:hypothetical protein
MSSILSAIIILQVIFIITLLQEFFHYEDKCPRQYIPHISHVTESTNLHDICGTWTSNTSKSTVWVSTMDPQTNTFYVDMPEFGSCIGHMDNYNNILTVSTYGVSDPTISLLLTNDALIDTHSLHIYRKNVDISTINYKLSGIWKDDYGTDVVDITVTDNIIKGTLASNKIVGLVNPDNMKFVIFSKGLTIPGYYIDNIFTISFMDEIYGFRKVS